MMIDVKYILQEHLLTYDHSSHFLPFMLLLGHRKPVPISDINRLQGRILPGQSFNVSHGTHIHTHAINNHNKIFLLSAIRRLKTGLCYTAKGICCIVLSL